MIMMTMTTIMMMTGSIIIAAKDAGRTWQSFNFDLGTNNYLEDGKFPDSNNQPYSVRPWGSWYVAAGSHTTHSPWVKILYRVGYRHELVYIQVSKGQYPHGKR